MKVEIMSRMRAMEFSLKEHSGRFAVISISDPDKDSPELQCNSDNGIFQQLKLHFTDVDVEQDGCITHEQARNIAEYVIEVIDKVDSVIVHCEAGMSRSAGVAAAVMKYLTGNDWGVFDNARFRPNMTCYRKVLSAFYELDVGDEP